MWSSYGASAYYYGTYEACTIIVSFGQISSMPAKCFSSDVVMVKTLAFSRWISIEIIFSAYCDLLVDVLVVGHCYNR